MICCRWSLQSSGKRVNETKKKKRGNENAFNCVYFRLASTWICRRSSTIWTTCATNKLIHCCILRIDTQNTSADIQPSTFTALHVVNSHVQERKRKHRFDTEKKKSTTKIVIGKKFSIISTICVSIEWRAKSVEHKNRLFRSAKSRRRFLRFSSGFICQAIIVRALFSYLLLFEFMKIDSKWIRLWTHVTYTFEQISFMWRKCITFRWTRKNTQRAKEKPNNIWFFSFFDWLQTCDWHWSFKVRQLWFSMQRNKLVNSRKRKTVKSIDDKESAETEKKVLKRSFVIQLAAFLWLVK